MGYACYSRYGIDMGCGVPSWCDYPGCRKKIDRGLAYLCGAEPGGDDTGCGLYFCSEHLFLGTRLNGVSIWNCERCLTKAEPFERKPDHPLWVRWKLEDESWAQWRAEHPDQVIELTETLL